ncbi:MAG: hypothetical protein LBV53_03020 [Mycoplasmataceae bacterium]|jgi:DNA-binding Xre family transcriptional regulator|nr:hypothetical protein [Mycoplasmataceae bacterium]
MAITDSEELKIVTAAEVIALKGGFVVNTKLSNFSRICAALEFVASNITFYKYNTASNKLLKANTSKKLDIK